jgi:hypothetical protein
MDLKQTRYIFIFNISATNVYYLSIVEMDQAQAFKTYEAINL